MSQLFLLISGTLCLGVYTSAAKKNLDFLRNYKTICKSIEHSPDDYLSIIPYYNNMLKSSTYLTQWYIQKYEPNLRGFDQTHVNMTSLKSGQ